ncbi:MAG TPA: response regulator transcription factor [Candidatus Polarisedimenticolaceae bacterium]
MSRQTTVLIADDDPHIREVVRFALRRENIECVEAGDGAAALAAFERTQPDLLILDILMPEMDGTEVCRRVRVRSNVPILFLSSKTDEIDKIVGLEIGADDYVTKPFSPRELVARVRAALRRANAPPVEAAPTHAMQHGKLRLDPDRHEALWDGRPVPLTAVEFGLLKTMLAHPGRVFTRESLMDSAYGEPTHVSGRTIDSHVRRIREKFAEAGGEPIETVRGVGYRVGDGA